MWKFSFTNIYLSILLIVSVPLTAQVITSTPPFPGENDSVIILFDATLGSGGLKNYTGEVYAHTGVITNASQSGSDWRYVKTAWGTNTPATRCERIGPDLYRITIKPSVRGYYQVPVSETIQQMAFVFRSDVPVGGGYLEGKGDGGADLYVDVFQPGLHVTLNKPQFGYWIQSMSDTTILIAQASNADSIALFQNGLWLSSSLTGTLTHQFIPITEGNQWFVAKAYDTSGVVSDSAFVFVRGSTVQAPIPQGLKEGINVISPSEVTLVLYAPLKSFAFLIGDFNNWLPDSASAMKRTPEGNHFWIHLSGLVPGKEYVFQYLVDGNIRIGDPYAEKVSDPWNDKFLTTAGILPYPSGKTQGIATVLSTSSDVYVWQNQSFTPPAKEELMIYELLIRDFTDTHSFESVIDTINYLKRLGINAIELMPVNEFEGNSSWGYNPNYYFAPDKYYGTKNQLKALIDTCHQLGIAVILDVVYNHSFGTSPYVLLWWDAAQNRPSANSPFYNMVEKHDFNVGFDFNHESAATRRYISRAVKHWLEEYRVDGYRFDLSKGFTQKQTLGNVAAWGAYDASRINILQHYADTIWSVNPDAYVILEHFADNSEEIELANRGMMLWGNLNHSYAEAAMGYHSNNKSNFSSVYHQNRGWSHPHLIGYMESHDEERLMYKTLQWGNQTAIYNTTRTDTALQRMQLNAAFFFTIPGPKMVWQFGELGYDYNIDYNGRTGEKPIRWDYTQVPARSNLYNAYASLMQLRKEDPLFVRGEASLSVTAAVKHLTITSPTSNALVVGNFDVQHQHIALIFPHPGIWYDYFGGDSLNVPDTGLVLSLAPGQYHLFLDHKRVPAYPVWPVWKPMIRMPDGIGHVYPNPSSGELNLYLDAGLEQETDLYVDVFDPAGRKISSARIPVKGQRHISITSVGDTLKTGLYLFRFTLGESISLKKVVIY